MAPGRRRGLGEETKPPRWLWIGRRAGWPPAAGHPAAQPVALPWKFTSTRSTTGLNDAGLIREAPAGGWRRTPQGWPRRSAWSGRQSLARLSEEKPSDAEVQNAHDETSERRQIKRWYCTRHQTGDANRTRKAGKDGNSPHDSTPIAKTRKASMGMLVVGMRKRAPMSQASEELGESAVATCVFDQGALVLVALPPAAIDHPVLPAVPVGAGAIALGLGLATAPVTVAFDDLVIIERVEIERRSDREIRDTHSSRLVHVHVRPGHGLHVEFADMVALFALDLRLLQFGDDPLDRGLVEAIGLRLCVDLGNVGSDRLALFGKALDALDDGADLVVGIAHAAASDWGLATRGAAMPKKSFAVTRPLVACVILSISPGLGTARPVAQRLTFCRLDETRLANSEAVIFAEVR